MKWAQYVYSPAGAFWVNTNPRYPSFRGRVAFTAVKVRPLREMVMCGSPLTVRARPAMVTTFPSTVTDTKLPCVIRFTRGGTVVVVVVVVVVEVVVVVVVVVVVDVVVVVTVGSGAD